MSGSAARNSRSHGLIGRFIPRFMVRAFRGFPFRARACRSAHAFSTYSPPSPRTANAKVSRQPPLKLIEELLGEDSLVQALTRIEQYGRRGVTILRDIHATHIAHFGIVSDGAHQSLGVVQD